MVDITSQMNTKIRFVRCPGCQKVLPELPDILLYRCGGCGTILQAKNRKNDIKETELSSEDTDCLQNREDDDVSGSLKQENTTHSLGSSPGNGSQGNQFDIENHKSIDEKFTDELPSSTELSGHENGRSSPEATESLEQDEYESQSCEDARELGNETLNEQPHDQTPSDELIYSDDRCLNKNEDSPAEIREDMMQNEERSSMGPKIVNYNEESQDNCRDQSGDGKSSDELHYSAELYHNNIESSLQGVSGCTNLNAEERLELSLTKDQNGCKDSNTDDKPEGNNFLKIDLLTVEGRSSPEAIESLERNENESHPCKDARELGNESLNVQPRDRTPSDELINSDDGSLNQNGDSSRDGNHPGEPSQRGGDDSGGGGSIFHSPEENGGCQKKIPGEIESSQDIEPENEDSSTALISSRNVETLMTMPETYADVNEDSEINFRTTTIVGSLSSKKEDELVANQSPFDEGVSENLYPAEKYLEHSPKNVSGFNRVGSDESLVSLPTIPRHPLGAMSRSPTRIYYGGDASIYSYEGNDDHTPDQRRYKGTFKATELPGTHRSPRTDGYMAKRMWDNELSGHHKQIASSSMFREMKNHASTGQEWSNNKLPLPRRKSGGIRRMRLDNDDPVSMNPYISRGSPLIHRNGSPSSHRQNMFEHHSGFSSHDTASFAEPNRLELLRMVYELEDELNRKHISKWTENGSFPFGGQGYEKHTTSVYDDLATEGDVYSDFVNSNEYNILTQGIGRPKKLNPSRMAFSGEAGYHRHQVDCLCSHCRPQDWQHSDSISHGKFQYAAHPSYHRHQAFSHTLTPKHHSGSGFSSRGQEIKSVNQKYKGNEIKRLHNRENNNATKRHTRPVAGGAPIIACCHCSELLQLPMDFLVFKRRYHQLRCNSCDQILKFSLEKKGHLLPSVPNDSIPPREIMDDNREAANSTNLVPISNSKRSPYAEPVSFSDEYDPSFSRSCSTEREPSMLTPETHLRKTTHNGKFSYGGSSQSMKESNMDSVSTNAGSIYRNSGKASEIHEMPAGRSSPVHQLANRNTISAFRDSGSTDKNSRKAFESAETSSKPSVWRTIPSEIEEVPNVPSSPAHQLANRNTNSAFRNSRITDKNTREAFESGETSSKLSNWRTLPSEIEEVPPGPSSPVHQLANRNSNSAFRNSRSTDRNTSDAIESAETSTKLSNRRMITSEIEELPAESVSPLHKLMGYSSPTQVIFGSPGSDSDEVTSYRNL